MSSSRLTINTSIYGRASSSQRKFTPQDGVITLASSDSSQMFGSNVPTQRLRSGSNASTTSSLSIVSPATSSTNASATSLPLCDGQTEPASHSFGTPIIPPFDQTPQSNAEYVLAMHDFAPQQQNATCLSFRAGQVIHVLNRDSSGWWDGELEGRRGWFPSNYVNADVSFRSQEGHGDTHVSEVFTSQAQLQ